MQIALGAVDRSDSKQDIRSIGSEIDRLAEGSDSLREEAHHLLTLRHKDIGIEVGLIDSEHILESVDSLGEGRGARQDVGRGMRRQGRSIGRGSMESLIVI